jgi:hypothetical protein
MAFIIVVAVKASSSTYLLIIGNLKYPTIMGLLTRLCLFKVDAKPSRIGDLKSSDALGLGGYIRTWEKILSRTLNAVPT